MEEITKEETQEIQKNIRRLMEESRLTPGGGFKSLSLSQADKTISGERQDTYGSPENSFEIIAEYWTTYLKNKKDSSSRLNAHDVTVMMTLFKLARISGQKWHRDNVIDAQGYLAILADRIHGGE